MKRENGFYWVKINGYWEVAKWSIGNWYLPGIENGWEDIDFTEIIEVRLTKKSK